MSHEHRQGGGSGVTATLKKVLSVDHYAPAEAGRRGVVANLIGNYQAGAQAKRNAPLKHSVSIVVELAREPATKNDLPAKARRAVGAENPIFDDDWGEQAMEVDKQRFVDKTPTRLVEHGNEMDICSAAMGPAERAGVEALRTDERVKTEAEEGPLWKADSLAAGHTRRRQPPQSGPNLAESEEEPASSEDRDEEDEEEEEINFVSSGLAKRVVLVDEADKIRLLTKAQSIACAPDSPISMEAIEEVEGPELGQPQLANWSSQRRSSALARPSGMQHSRRYSLAARVNCGDDQGWLREDSGFGCASETIRPSFGKMLPHSVGPKLPAPGGTTCSCSPTAQQLQQQAQQSELAERGALRRLKMRRNTLQATAQRGLGNADNVNKINHSAKQETVVIDDGAGCDSARNFRRTSDLLPQSANIKRIIANIESRIEQQQQQHFNRQSPATSKGINRLPGKQWQHSSTLVSQTVFKQIGGSQIDASNLNAVKLNKANFIKCCSQNTNLGSKADCSISSSGSGSSTNSSTGSVGGKNWAQRRQSLQISLLTGDQQAINSLVSKSLTEEELRGEREFNEQVRQSTKSPDCLAKQQQIDFATSPDGSGRGPALIGASGSNLLVHRLSLSNSVSTSAGSVRCQSATPALGAGGNKLIAGNTGPLKQAASSVLLDQQQQQVQATGRQRRQAEAVSEQLPIKRLGKPKRRVSFGSIDSINANYTSIHNFQLACNPNRSPTRERGQRSPSQQQPILKVAPSSLPAGGSQKRHSFAFFAGTNSRTLDQYEQRVNPPGSNQDSALQGKPEKPLRTSLISGRKDNNNNIIEDESKMNEESSNGKFDENSGGQLGEGSPSCSSKNLSPENVIKEAEQNIIDHQNENETTEAAASGLQPTETSDDISSPQNSIISSGNGSSSNNNNYNSSNSTPSSLVTSSTSPEVILTKSNQSQRTERSRVQSIMANAKLRQEEFARLLEEHEQIVNEINRVETKISCGQTNLQQKEK